MGLEIVGGAEKGGKLVTNCQNLRPGRQKMKRTRSKINKIMNVSNSQPWIQNRIGQVTKGQTCQWLFSTMAWMKVSGAGKS